MARSRQGKKGKRKGPRRDAAGRFVAAKRKTPKPPKPRKPPKPPKLPKPRKRRIPEPSYAVEVGESDLATELGFYLDDDGETAATVTYSEPGMHQNKRGTWLSFEHGLSTPLPLDEAPALFEVLRDSYAMYRGHVTSLALMVVDRDNRTGIEEVIYRQVSMALEYDAAFDQVEDKIAAWSSIFTSRHWAGFVGVNLQFLVDEERK